MPSSSARITFFCSTRLPRLLNASFLPIGGTFSATRPIRHFRRGAYGAIGAGTNVWRRSAPFRFLQQGSIPIANLRKRHLDVFFRWRGCGKNSWCAVSVFQNSEALRSKGLKVDIPHERLPHDEFLRRLSSMAGLVAVGHSWCYRTAGGGAMPDGCRFLNYLDGRASRARSRTRACSVVRRNPGQSGRP